MLILYQLLTFERNTAFWGLGNQEWLINILYQSWHSRITSFKNETRVCGNSLRIYKKEKKNAMSKTLNQQKIQLYTDFSAFGYTKRRLHL